MPLWLCSALRVLSLGRAKAPLMPFPVPFPPQQVRGLTLAVPTLQEDLVNASLWNYMLLAEATCGGVPADEISTLQPLVPLPHSANTDSRDQSLTARKCQTVLTSPLLLPDHTRANKVEKGTCPREKELCSKWYQDDWLAIQLTERDLGSPLLSPAAPPVPRKPCALMWPEAKKQRPDMGHPAQSERRGEIVQQQK
ncbi:hypothetical protein CB1_001322005 [Camelus ferus]|nr:hypothetical protein CB1_001322005 [Camelus ferus]